MRSGRITLKQGNITLNAVLAEEINPPKGETPLKWLLLTSEPVESLAQALRVIDIYTHRWRIEEFHVRHGKPEQEPRGNAWRSREATHGGAG